MSIPSKISKNIIGQKIPVDWADESMYVREIRRTFEEKQKKNSEFQTRRPSGNAPSTIRNKTVEDLLLTAWYNRSRKYFG